MQTLDFTIQKDGFERKDISYEIDKDEIDFDPYLLVGIAFSVISFVGFKIY